MEIESTELTPSAPESAAESSSPVEQSPAPAAEPTGLDAIKAASTKEKPVVDAPKEVAKAYNPNYKFKAYQKEYEIDEWVRPFIKDEDTEKKFKKLYERAYGYDFKAQKHDELKGQFDEVKKNYDQTEKALSILSGYVNENDFDSFFDGLNIPKNKVLEYALELVKREQMSPDQRQQWEANQQARHAAAVRHLKAVNPTIGGAQVPNTSQVVQASQKPVIPNIQGRGTSAVKSTVKSLDDLKKRARDLSSLDY